MTTATLVSKLPVDGGCQWAFPGRWWVAYTPSVPILPHTRIFLCLNNLRARTRGSAFISPFSTSHILKPQNKVGPIGLRNMAVVPCSPMHLSTPVALPWFQGPAILNNWPWLAVSSPGNLPRVFSSLFPGCSWKSWVTPSS